MHSLYLTDFLQLYKHKSTMAILSLSPTILILLLLALLNLVYSQQQTDPTIASCGPLLFSLVSCAPFVQGTADSPTQPCCNSLSQLYTQQPGCLCLLLNSSIIATTFPINTTLATQLPLLCSLQADNNTAICSGVAAAPANPPASQIPSGPHPNTTTAASPTITMTPRTSILGYRHSDGTKSKIKSHLAVLIAAYIFM